VSRIRYVVAASLDGYIAGPNGEIDWIVQDPDVDFEERFAQFDTFLVGRRTYEVMLGVGRGTIPGKRLVVFSRTLRQEDHSDVTIVSEEPGRRVAELRAESAADIWLFGGGDLFASLLELGVVDSVEVAVVPVLLGGGIPLMPVRARRTELRLTGHRLYPKTGIMSLEYAVPSAS
jgi:dihydrofolate reductase